MSETEEKRKPPDHSTKTRSKPYSFRPLTKQSSIARYTTNSQTVVNHSALHMDNSGFPEKHNDLQARSKSDKKTCDHL